jgi:lysophospholipase L1-like esterase
MKVHKGSKLLFLGDSITDAGRTRPVGEGLFDPMGKGFVNVVTGLLGSCYPEYDIRIVNMGCSGDTVRHLKERWQCDVENQAPDWLVVMICVNDVWRQFDMPLITEQHVYIEEYEATLNELVASAKTWIKGGIVLMSPHYIEPNPQDAMRSTMDKYGRAVERVTLKHNTIFVDIQAAFNNALRFYNANTLAWDRVHPTIVGHSIIAKAFLNAIDFDWNHMS